MTIQQLEYILDVNRTGSISRTAKNFMVSQSSVSNAINTLETELGFAIFDRNWQGAVPTVEGEEVLRHAVQICEHTRAIQAPKVVRQELTFRNDAPEKPLLYIINRVEGCTERQRAYFTAAELESGKAEITVNVVPGSYYVYTVARNEYGFYSSAPCFFTVEAAE